MPLTSLDSIHQLNFDTYQEFDTYLRGHLHGNLVSHIRDFFMMDGSLYNKFWVKRKRWRGTYPYYRVAVIGDVGGHDTLTKIHVVNIFFSKVDGSRDPKDRKCLTIFGGSNIRKAKGLVKARKKEEERISYKNSAEYKNKVAKKQYEKELGRERWQERKEAITNVGVKLSYIKQFGMDEYKLHRDNVKMMKMHLEYEAEFDEEGNHISED